MAAFAASAWAFAVVDPFVGPFAVASAVGPSVGAFAVVDSFAVASVAAGAWVVASPVSRSISSHCLSKCHGFLWHS